MNKSLLSNSIVLLLDSRGFGGIESHVLQLSCALKNAGYSIRVVLLRHYGPHPLETPLAREGITLLKLEGFRDLMRLFSSSPRLIHSHGYKAGILARLLGAFTGVPVVSSFHAGEPGKGRIRLYNLLDRLSAPLAPAIAVSDKIAAAIPGGARVIANFVPPAKEIVLKRTANIAFVGRLSHEKGADLFCRLCEQHSAGRFEIYGDGPDRAVLEAKHGDKVKFHGAIPDMSPCWPDIDLLCITSRHEGLPLVALEAMSRGIPVLAFAVGDLPKLIRHGDNGWLIDEGDLDAMAACLHQWQTLSSQHRQKMSEKARQTIAKGYSPRAVLPQIIDVYRQAVPAFQ